MYQLGYVSPIVGREIFIWQKYFIFLVKKNLKRTDIEKVNSFWRGKAKNLWNRDGGNIEYHNVFGSINCLDSGGGMAYTWESLKLGGSSIRHNPQMISQWLAAHV